MFCDKCGAPAQPDQRFCGRCGKEFAGGPIASPRRSRVAEHIRLLGILWLALSALNAVAGVFLLILANALFPHLREMGAAPPDVPVGFLHSLFGAIGAIVLLKALIGFFAGWGLLQRESWARVLTIVLAFLALFNIPFGTALGIYSLWVLLPAAADAEYQQQVRSADAA
ncbi:MAG TPA: zinc ribbon domain-containing protein [Terriglobales bacterium]|nr:zinc ribbon domain-containing protein [Terriglobales bacterium]